MPPGHGLPIIAHGNRQEVILDVGIFHALIRPDKATGLKLVGRAKALLGQKPLRPDQRLAPNVPVFVKRYRLGGLILHVDLKMVLQVRPHTGAVRHDVNPVILQMRRIANP